MNIRNTSKKDLNDILSEYDNLALSHPQVLRNLIPAKEIWRFFIDGCSQENGRSLKSLDVFKIKSRCDWLSIWSNPLSLTIHDYMKKIEGDASPNLTYSSNILLSLREHNWFLTIDLKKNLTFNDLLKLDKGWYPYELNEPGYLKALCNAFPIIFDFSKKFDVEFIKSLHRSAVLNVNDTNCDPDQVGLFRSSSKGYCPIRVPQLKKQDIFELIKKMEMRKHKVYEDISIFLNVGGISEFLINSRFFVLTKSTAFKNAIEDKKIKLLKKFSIPDAKFNHFASSFLKEIISAKTTDEYATAIFNHIISSETTKMGSYQVSNANEKLEKRMNSLVDKLNGSLENTKDPFKKLILIVNFNQQCEQLHPFVDANTRTFSMLTLNHLLLRHGFPPAILENPNCMGGCATTRELLERVMQGMKNTFALIKDEALYNMKTDDLLKMLNSKPVLSDSMSYFNEIIGNEELSRKNSLLLNMK